MRFIRFIGVATLAASMLGGCNDMNSGEKPQPQRSIEDEGGQVPNNQDQASGQQTTPSGEADQYGRLPGDEHYGHDHPPQDQQQNNTVQPGSPVQSNQATGSGEPDQYGRLPGDAHYGHDHPPLDEEEKQGQTQQGSPIQTQQVPADGEPDQYGRLPGDEHYGHNHPPEDQQ